MRQFVRNISEGVVFSFLFPLWLILASFALLAGIARGRRRKAGAFRAAIRRWGILVSSGLRCYREAWWPLPQFEKQSVFWRHALWTEFFSALNMAGQAKNAGENRLLVIKLAHLGDTMHIGPMLAALHRAKPEAVIDLMVGPWCEDLATRWKPRGKVLVYTPHLLLFHRGNRNKGRGWLSEFRWMMALRCRSYTTVFSTSTLTMAEWLLIQAVNPGQWIGADNPITLLYPEIPRKTESYDSKGYEANRVGGLLRYLGLPEATGLPDYPLLPDEEAWAEKQWTPGKRRVLVAPGAGWPGKVWPVERFGALVDWLQNRFGVQVLITGAPDEKSMGDAIVAMNPSAKTLAGQTTFGQTAALVKSAELFIGNDSGPLHLAAAFNTPSVALFGPTVASKWHPPGRHHIMIQKEGYCEGCVGWHPAARCAHQGACMNAISVDEVFDAAAKLMAS